jgi:outer membrane protein TolC
VSAESGDSLSAEQAITRALANNPSLSATRQNLRGAREQVRAESGRYPYAVLADGGFTRSQSPQLRADDSVAASTTRTLDLSVAVKKPFAFGGSAEVRATEQHFDRDAILSVTVSPFTPANTGHAATLRATVSQPFLRGFGAKVGEAELRAAQSTYVGAEKTIDRTRSALVRDVLTAYYELWYASQALEIDRASLALAQRQEQQTAERVELGDLALAESLTFQTRSSELEESVVTSRLTRRQRSITLGTLMGSADERAGEWVPANPPPVSDGATDLSELERAIADDSVELAELEAQLRTAQVRAEVAGDAVRPRVDGNAYVQTNGLSTDITNAWARAASLDWWTAYVGVSVELPTDMSRQHALAAQAHANVASLQAQLVAKRNQVAADALSALSTSRASRERLTTAERTLSIAERSQAAAAGRFELGQAAAISVQQAEEDLRRARLRVARARVDIAQQQVQLDHLSGALEQRYPL